MVARMAMIREEIDGTKSGLARVLGKFHASQISVGFKIDTRADDTDALSVFMLKAGGMLMPTEAYYLDPEYSEDRVRYLALGAEMLEAAGYADPAALMRLAFDVEYAAPTPNITTTIPFHCLRLRYRIASFDNSEEATTYTGYDGSVDPSDTGA